jgi:hypothetical protein
MAKQKGIMRYVHGIPRKLLARGRVLVHNHVIPQRAIGLNGFRAWTQPLSASLEVVRAIGREWTFAELFTIG